MKLLIGSSILLIISAVGTLANGAAAQQSPKLTTTQAIQIASQFCQKVGQPLTVAGTAVYPVPENLHPIQPYWQKCWRITFPGQAELEVSDEAGVVSYYTNYEFYRQYSNQPADQAIPEAQAIKIARNVLQATGEAEELQYSQAQLAQDNNPPMIVGHSWLILWKRSAAGIIYRDEHAAITLNAETGKVVGMSLMFPSPPSTHRQASVSRADSDNIILNALENRMQDYTLQSVTEEMVQPNSFWATGDIKPIPGEAHRVWSYQFKKDDTVLQAWVDRATGEVVGGELIGTADETRNSRSSVSSTDVLANALHQCDQLVVIEVTNSSHTILIADFSKTNSQPLFYKIKSESKLYQNAISLDPTIIVRFFRHKHLIYSAGYSQVSGLISAPHSTLLLPKAATVYINKRIKTKTQNVHN